MTATGEERSICSTGKSSKLPNGKDTGKKGVAGSIAQQPAELRPWDLWSIATEPTPAQLQVMTVVSDVLG